MVSIERTIPKLKKVAIRAAKKAGEIQMRRLGKIHDVRFKGEINLVTEVDRACEEAIHRILSKEFPDHEFLMEESGLVVGKHSGKAGFRWIVDPLDGTTNYTHGYPLFCTSIGLEYRGELLLGVVYEPNREDLYVAVRGEGAERNGKRIRVSKAASLGRALLATGFAYNVRETDKNNVAEFGRFLMTAQAVRRDGVAAVDLCYVACGRYDGFWERDLWPWDVAAGAVILREAGGSLSLFDGRPYDIYEKEIVASNSRIHREMIGVLSRVKQ